MIARPVLGVSIDPRLVGHVAIALAGYQRALRAVGRDTPAGYDALVEQLDQTDKSGQFCREGCSHVHADHVPLVLSINDVAAVLHVSERTVRRRLADGTIQSTLIGRRRLVHRDAIVELLAS